MIEKARILIVDDEQGVLAAVSRCFMDTGYDLLTASSGREALEIMASDCATTNLIPRFTGYLH